MRLAIVVNRFPTLSETFIFNKVIGISTSGYDVTVITHSPSNDWKAYKNSQNTLSTVKIVQAFSAKSLLDLRLYFQVAMNFRRVCQFVYDRLKKGDRPRACLRNSLHWLSLQGNYRIIHFAYTGLAITYLKVLPYLKPAAIFASCRGAAEQIKPLVDCNRAKELSELFLIVDRVHCVSDDMLRTCVSRYGLSLEKAFVNRPAIDTTMFSRSDHRIKNEHGPIRICSTGRLHWKKGFEYSLIAMRELKDRGVSILFTIIGGGVEVERLKFMASDLGISDRVDFAGNMSSSDVRKQLELSDIYLSSSISEGISNAVLEAMAMGLPVVSTRAGGMDEVIIDQESGILINPYSASQIADALKFLIDNPEVRNEIGERARKVIENNFTISRQIQIFRNQYQAIHDVEKDH